MRGLRDILMIGDNYTNDFLVPKSLGMQALYLDRKGNNSETTINSLSVLLERL
jgi:FMN phosphatase YigB (HAD superfamily)